MSAAPRIYVGSVVHTRFRPIKHKLKYSVFNILLDCGALNEAGAGARLFTVNRPGLLSFHEKDHGDGGALAPYLRKLADQAGKADQVERFLLICYPRVLGFVFNPISVYYGLGAAGRPVLMIYEVRNTFGEMLTYVIGVDDPDAKIVEQNCDKQFYVSPFNKVEGRYDFRVMAPGEEVSVGVRLSTDEGTILLASFHGKGVALNDREILKALSVTGWLTVKVVLGIHWEALKLWLKGLRITRRPKAPANTVRHENHRQAMPRGADGCDTKIAAE